MKISKNVFMDLEIKMIGFGVCVGIAFPFFLLAFGFQIDMVMTRLFFSACILAGIIVGFINFFISKFTVGRKLAIITEKMEHVSNNLNHFDSNTINCEKASADCFVEEDSPDEFGACADAFNSMVESLISTLVRQKEHRKYVESLSENLVLSSIAQVALNSFVQYSKASAGAILVESDGLLKKEASLGLSDVERISSSNVVLSVLKSGERKLVDFPKDVKLDGIIGDYQPAQLIVEPIKYNGETVGVVVLANTGNFEVEFLSQLDLLVHDFSLVLNNSLKHEQIQRLAVLDPLTGIYNRRFGLTRLEEEHARSQRTQNPLGVIMFDIDKFKLTNDTYGHVAGDRVIKNMVTSVKGILRNGDVLVRYGGEEFLVVLPNSNKESTYKIAERMREKVSESLTHFGNFEIQSNISLGVDSFPETQVLHHMDLVSNADKALYAAKNSGRNMTIMHDKEKVDLEA